MSSPAARQRAVEASLQALAAARLGEGFAVAARSVDAGHSAGPEVPLPPTLAAASPRRHATFRTGRACAFAALEALGCQQRTLPTGASGAPVWPRGFAGSISHTDHLGAAVVACDPPVGGLGLDIEDDLPLDDAQMFRLVCRPEEWLTGYDPAHPASLLHGKLLFVVKEAVYKLHHPLGGAFLDFQDVRIALDTSAGCYSAELVDPAKQGSAGRTIRGGFARANGLLIALATYYR